MPGLSRPSTSFVTAKTWMPGIAGHDGSKALPSENRAGHRPRVAIWPGARIGGLEKVRQMHVEDGRLLEVDVVARVSHHDQCGGRDVLLHEDAWLQTWPVLVAGHDQSRHGDCLHLVDQVEQ